MKRIMWNAVSFAVCAAAAATSPAAFGAMHATEEFEEGATRPVSIAFLPPHASLMKRKIVQSESQVEESIEFSQYLAASIEQTFEAQGYEVRMLTPEQIGSDAELQELVLDADRRYAELHTQMAAKLPRQIAKRRYKAGDEMRLLAAKLDVDAIGFADMQIVASAAGASAVSVLVGIGSSGSQTMMSVTLIDGATAELEAHFVPPVLRRGSIAGYDAIMEDPAGKIAEITQQTLKELPAADPSKRRASAEDDVLSDLESLLEE